jgi:hypothetical protein
VSAISTLAETHGEGPLLGAAEDRQLERRVEGLEQIVDPVDGAPGGRHDQVTLGESGPRRRTVVLHFANEQPVHVRLPDGAPSRWATFIGVTPIPRRGRAADSPRPSASTRARRVSSAWIAR